MRISTSITRSLMGLAFASSLFLGCEQFMGDDKETAKKLDVNAPEDVALQLSVKQTDECKALRDRVLAARNAGEATGDLEAGFIRNCIEEIKPVDGRRDTVLPPNLVPDAATRCHWIVAQIDGGRDEMVIRFKYYCPDSCDTLARRDTAGHVKYCRDPQADCEELRRKLANMDPLSEEYARLKRFLDGTCGIKPPIDTIIRPRPPTFCDSLRHLLSAGDLDSAGKARIMRLLAEKCGRDTVRPPSDTIIKPRLLCDSLRHAMDSGMISTEDSIRIARQLAAYCGILPPCDTIVVPPKPVSYCDSLYRLLMTGNLDTASLIRIKHLLAERCGIKPPIDTIIPPKPVTFCDSLRRLLDTAHLDSASIARIKHLLAEKCGAAPVPLTCSQIKDRMANLDPASAEYARLKALFAEKCGVINPPISDCEAYRSKLANLDPNSEDYARLKAIVDEKCMVIQPVK